MATSKSEQQFFSKKENDSVSSEKTKKQLVEENQQLKTENQLLREEILDLKQRLNIHISDYNSTHCVASYD
jgi:hypothetical protein